MPPPSVGTRRATWIVWLASVRSTQLENRPGATPMSAPLGAGVGDGSGSAGSGWSGSATPPIIRTMRSPATAAGFGSTTDLPVARSMTVITGPR